MCNANCCCRNYSSKILIYILLSFIIINLILSFIAIFIRAAKTERYEEALKLLAQRNKETNFTNYTITNCRETKLLSDNKYCNINGKRLKRPEEKVNYKSLFKNWNSNELLINILRVIFTGAYLIFLFFIIFKYKKYIEIRRSNENIDPKEKKKNNLFWILSIVFLIILIIMSSIFLLIRAFALTANDDIGLYEEGKQNQFEQYIAINYIIDIINIVLNSIGICFSIRIKRSLNIEPVKPTQNIIIPPPQPSNPEIQIIQTKIIQQDIIVGNPKDTETTMQTFK